MAHDSLGTVTPLGSCAGLVYLSIRLTRPVPAHEPELAPDCLFITRSLHAVDRWDYLRLTGSIVLPARQHLGIRFLNRPVLEWMGYGRLRKKLIQVLEIVTMDGVDVDWKQFSDLVRFGISYPGIMKKRKRKVK